VLDIRVNKFVSGVLHIPKCRINSLAPLTVISNAFLFPTASRITGSQFPHSVKVNLTGLQKRFTPAPLSLMFLERCSAVGGVGGS